MGNATLCGIYRFIATFFSIALFSIGFSQDYYVDLKGDTQQVEITNWFFNHFICRKGKEVEAIFTDDVQSVYRSQAELTYVPYSSYSSDSSYIDFFIPSVQSVKNLATDFFADDNFEVWVSGDYMLFEIVGAEYSNVQDFEDVFFPMLSSTSSYQLKFDNYKLFKAKDREYPIEIPKGIIFIYHDSVGFDKIVAEDMEEDYFKLLLSRYTFDAALNDSIFNEDFKLRQNKFLDFFDQNISALTQVQFNDRDLAKYYIASLNEGALIVLLNLDMRKIDLYRNSGNASLANKLEEKLFLSNRSTAVSFLDSAVYNFSKVYVADAKSRTLILDGVRTNIFLNADLEVDSSIVLEEEFFLFARNGQVFETQPIDQTNKKKKQVTSTPVIQDALVIYDHKNVQIMDPFPFFIREFSSGIKASGGKVKKNSNTEQNESGFEDSKELIKYLADKYNMDKLISSKVSLASALNNSFFRFYRNSFRGNTPDYKHLTWMNSYIWESKTWKISPQIIHKNSDLNEAERLNSAIQKMY